MATHSYICLSCGSQFAAVKSAKKDETGNNCPVCNSSRVTEINIANYYNFFGGG